MEYSKKTQQLAHKPDEKMVNRIGEPLVPTFWEGAVTKFSIIFGGTRKEKSPTGLVYSIQAEIIIEGRILKILPPPEGSDIPFIIDHGEQERLMKFIFLEKDSPFPHPYFDEKAGIVLLFYPFAIMPTYINALETATTMDVGILPAAAGKSFLRITGELMMPEKEGEQQDN